MQRIGYFILFVMLAPIGFSLTLLKDAGGIDANPWLILKANPAQFSLREMQKIALPGFPARSKLGQASFKAYQINACTKLEPPFFVIGSDPFSITWFNIHKTFLQKRQAIGLITNIESEEKQIEIEALSALPLIPSNIDELAKIFQVPGYPFFTNGCEVWQ